jgi:hypothetical protein
MVETTTTTPAFQISFKAFGVPIRISAPGGLVDRIADRLPPGSVKHEPTDEDHHFQLVTSDGISYRLEHDDYSISASSDVDVALEVLDAKLRLELALHAPDHIFMHAGVVAYRERAILVPGMTFTGKTTLVTELVRAGAVYYSDEFAPIDSRGHVYPFPKPLSVRPGDGSWSQTDHDVSELGGTVGNAPAPIAIVALASYAPGATWSPKQLSAGESTLALLDNTVPASARPAEAMTAVGAVAARAVVLKGERGEASEIVRPLLELVETSTAGHNGAP